MNTMSISACAALLLAPALPAADAAGESAPSIPGYTLVWHDEFTAPGRPDPAKWDYQEGFVRNEEMQWYQRENAFCENGLLIIEGRRETVKNPRFDPASADWRLNRPEAHYTSACLVTKGKFSCRYGRFEMRARFTPAEGMWPAFWTLGVSEHWPSCGEIDIMEYYKGKFLANLCWSKEGKNRWDSAWSTKTHPVAELEKESPGWSSRFHVYRMDWDEKEVRLYIDGRLINRTSLEGTLNARWEKVRNPFRQPHYILVNLALGATGGSLENLSFPQRYEVDYIRVYRKTKAKK